MNPEKPKSTSEKPKPGKWVVGLQLNIRFHECTLQRAGFSKDEAQLLGPAGKGELTQRERELLERLGPCIFLQ